MFLLFPANLFSASTSHIAALNYWSSDLDIHFEKAVVWLFVTITFTINGFLSFFVTINLFNRSY